MKGLLWRLHRPQVVFAAAALAVAVLVLLLTGTAMAAHYRTALGACAPTRSCALLPGELFHGDGFIIDLVNASLFVPLLIGLFWGAPLVAGELEAGTHVLAWTQAVSRARWFVVSALSVMGAGTLVATVLTVLVTWWRTPENALAGSRFGIDFDITGIVPIAYTIFGLALGIAAGTIVRRVLPALALTIGGFVLARVAVALWWRPHFLPAVHASFPLRNDASGAPAGSWVLSRTIESPRGRAANGIAAVPHACHAAYFAGNAIGCMARLGYRRVVEFQPASRFWTFQGIEAAAFLAATAVLLAVAGWVVVRRDI